MSKNLAAALAAGLALASLSASALAAELVGKDAQVNGITVKYGDLDLSKRGDVRTLLARLERAANKACGAVHGLHPASALSARHTPEFMECRDNAVSQAVAAVGAPTLVAALKTGT